jgi:hypothetical protein
MNDPRVTWGRNYIVLSGDPSDHTAFKFGYPNEYGWVAYFACGYCFIKKFTPAAGKYPDLGCSYESYITYWGAEMEALSPLSSLSPGETTELKEEWYLFEAACPSTDDAEIARTLSGFADEAGIILPG